MLSKWDRKWSNNNNRDRDRLEPRTIYSMNYWFGCVFLRHSDHYQVRGKWKQAFKTIDISTFLKCIYWNFKFWMYIWLSWMFDFCQIFPDKTQQSMITYTERERDRQQEWLERKTRKTKFATRNTAHAHPQKTTIKNENNWNYTKMMTLMIIHIIYIDITIKTFRHNVGSE